MHGNTVGTAVRFAIEGNGSKKAYLLHSARCAPIVCSSGALPGGGGSWEPGRSLRDQILFYFVKDHP